MRTTHIQTSVIESQIKTLKEVKTRLSNTQISKMSPGKILKLASDLAEINGQIKAFNMMLNSDTPAAIVEDPNPIHKLRIVQAFEDRGSVYVTLIGKHAQYRNDEPVFDFVRRAGIRLELMPSKHSLSDIDAIYMTGNYHINAYYDENLEMVLAFKNGELIGKANLGREVAEKVPGLVQ